MTWQGTIGAPPYPIELAELQRRLHPQSPVPWENLPAPVFLHGLTDASGRRRLVSVYALANNPPGWWTLHTSVREVVSPGTGRRAQQADANPPIISSSCWPMGATTPAAGGTLVVFAGQADKSDL